MLGVDITLTYYQKTPKHQLDSSSDHDYFSHQECKLYSHLKMNDFTVFNPNHLSLHLTVKRLLPVTKIICPINLTNLEFLTGYSLVMKLMKEIILVSAMSQHIVGTNTIQVITYIIHSSSVSTCKHTLPQSRYLQINLCLHYH